MNIIKYDGKTEENNRETNKYNETNILIQKGDDKIKNNEFLRDLSEIMENETFQRFFSKYMCDNLSLKCSTIYMKLYQEFKDKYKKISGNELDKSIIIYIIGKIMEDKMMRPFSIKTIERILEDGKGDFFGEFESFLKDNNKTLLIKDKVTKYKLTK